jgi:hypothetical protein
MTTASRVSGSVQKANFNGPHSSTGPALPTVAARGLSLHLAAEKDGSPRRCVQSRFGQDDGGIYSPLGPDGWKPSTKVVPFCGVRRGLNAALSISSVDAHRVVKKTDRALCFDRVMVRLVSKLAVLPHVCPLF